MITVCQGKVGDGKSYHMMSLIARHLCNGGVVATNMSVNLDNVRANFGRAIQSRQLLLITATDSPFSIPRGDLRGRGRRRVMVVLDEALNWFASSGGAKDDRKATWGEWLRQSDKLGQDVYFIAQAFDRAAKWIRELAQTMISITNLRNFTFLKLPVGRMLCLRRVYAAAVYDVRAAFLVSWGLHIISPRVWECYDTSELYGFPASANAYQGLEVWPPFKLPFWPLWLPFLGVLVGWVWLRVV